MRYLKDTGFVLKRINFGDSDRYITIFTKNHGKVEVVARGVRKITSRRAPSIELLNLIEFQAVRGSKNYILTEVKLLDSFGELKNDLNNIEKVFSMCELLEAIMPYNAKHAEVFSLVHNTCDKIKNEPESLMIFQARLLSMLGYWDRTFPFKNEDHIRSYIEQILERKLKTRNIFKT